MPTWIEQLLQWLLSAIGGAAVLGTVGLFFKDQIAGFIGSRTKHALDKKLENLRSELNAKTAELGALRQDGLNAQSNRRSITDTKRIEAYEQLWSAIQASRPLATSASFLSVLKFRELAEETSKNSQLTTLFKEMARAGNWDQFPELDTHQCRLYVSPVVWSTFSAYQMALADCFARWAVLRTGVPVDVYFDNEAVWSVLGEALPEWKKALTDHRSAVVPQVLTALENKLLGQIRESLAGHDDDRQAVERAQLIVQMIDQARIDAELKKAEATKP